MKQGKESFRRFLILFLAVAVLALSPGYSPAASSGDYCIMPPYVKTDVKPNIMIMMDNAQGMAAPAYAGNYDPSRTYAGYFKPNLKYSYSNKWVPDASGIYSGNLLNWAVTSKYDLLESILVGGISASRQTNINVLVNRTNSWVKELTYTDSLGNSRTCVFRVDSVHGLQVEDKTAGSCGYLDTPTAYPLTSALETGLRFALAGDKNEKDGLLKGLARAGFKMLAYLLDTVTPQAEAAKTLAIHGGPSALNNGPECTAGYSSGTITADGGTDTNYTWTWSAGKAGQQLPPGLTFSNTSDSPPGAVISGTPTMSGTYNFTVTVNNASGETDSKDYSVTIDGVTPVITSASPLQEGYVGSYYYVPLSAGPCSSGYVWSLASGSMPPGFSILSSSIVFNSNPSTAGTYTFTLKATHGTAFATKEFRLTINPSPGTLTITTGTPLHDGTVGAAFFSYIETDPLVYPGQSRTWTFSGTLPPGMTLNTATTQYYTSVSGTPTTVGTYTFTVTVSTKDNSGNPFSASKTFTITVSGQAQPPPSGIRTSGYKDLKICAGNYSVNCNDTSSATPGTDPCAASDTTQCVLKSGIVDQFWPQARFGVMDFNKLAGNAVTNIGKCTDTDPAAGSTPDSDFLSAIENAVPIDPTTTLVNGEYAAVYNYYAYANNPGTCDPIDDKQCRKNFVLMISAGVGADNPPNPGGGSPNMLTTMPASCSADTIPNLAKNACFGSNVDIRSSSYGKNEKSGQQHVFTYIVNTMGTPKDNDPNTTTAGDILSNAALLGGGNYYEVTDPTELKNTLMQAFQDIIKRAASGTAASVLASGEGSGANLVQAVFYPRRKFINSATGGYDEIAWVGRLSNLWYFVDPFFVRSNIREDDGDKILNSKTDSTHKDYITQLYFDPTVEATKARRWADTNGDGVADGVKLEPDIAFEYMGSLWEAGLELWKRDLATSPRSIYTTIGDSNADGTPDIINFSTAQKTNLRPYLQAADDDESEAIIRFSHGEDKPVVNGTLFDYRTRTVKVDLNGDGDTLDTVDGISEGTARVWKLADVLNSTPKVSSWLKLNSYDTAYGDDSYKSFTQTGSGTTADYKDRGMVFAGANDGMLHAFKLGKLELDWSGKGVTEYARLTGNDLGKEVWAFIPKNVLPYLKYLAEQTYGDCHIYSVDLSPYVFDASIGTEGCSETNYWDCSKYASGAPVSPPSKRWRTILIGGMRFGGACRKKDTCAAGSDCVNTPALDPGDNNQGLGYSAYFALDITDQSSAPQLLWEFYRDDLGFATTGPAVVKISPKVGDTNSDGNTDGKDRGDKTKNGRWFVVIGSGPTGPISSTGQQFLGRSDQEMKVFIFDLKTGPTDGNIWAVESGIPYGFASSLSRATHDIDQDYQDEAVYIPYVKKALDGTWTDGGVARIKTNRELSPDNWSFGKVIDGIGPVTSSVPRLLNRDKGDMWLFFGTGRYFFEQQSTVDDPDGQRQIIGLKDPCFDADTKDYKATCPSALTDLSTLTNVTSIPDAASTDIGAGWYINLDATGTYSYCGYYNSDGTCGSTTTRDFKAERIVTDPSATSSGLIFFTGYKPYSDECTLGGKSFIWSVKYNTGGAPGAMLKGKALIQVSTGSIEQLDLSSVFTQAGGRKSSSIEGVPPMAGSGNLSLIVPPQPTRSVIHVRER